MTKNMTKYNIKKRMIEIVKMIQKNPREKTNWWTITIRKNLASYIKQNRKVWLEVKQYEHKL